MLKKQISGPTMGIRGMGIDTPEHTVKRVIITEASVRDKVNRRDQKGADPSD